MKNKIILGVTLSGIIFSLAIASVFTSFGIWDGVIPSAHFIIKVIDDNNKPVIGATLLIFRKENLFGINKNI